MRAEHIYNSVVEAQYLLDTKQKHLLGDTLEGLNQASLKTALLKGGDMVNMRK